MLEIINVSKTFQNANGERIPAVSSLDLTVARNEFVCVVGMSGCGKTTTLRLVAGLDKPTEGRILVDGRKVNGPTPERCVVFQKYTLFPWRTVRDNVAFGLEIRRMNRQDRMARVRKYLELVGLGDYEMSYPFELSGGMQQRVAVARALAAEPKILLMDEPFGALDSRTREILQNELIGIWCNERKTILFVTHSISEAITLADRVVVMTRPGRIRRLIDIDLPRPRDKNCERFRKYNAQVRDLLNES
jgi:NitT/TauT family transport system ATP-binding protein